MQHIVPLTAYKVHEPTPTDGIPLTSSVTPKTQSFTPSFALSQLTPPQSLLRKNDTHLIDFSEDERKRGKKNPHQPHQCLQVVVTMLTYRRYILDHPI